MPELSAAQISQFHDDGFLIIDRLIEPDEAARVAARFEPLFRGKFETGLYPDEWNWREGESPPDRTRQICNGWKSDRTIASLVLRAEIGRLAATLASWPGARMGQDNVLWKPPGAKSLGYHQDNSYVDWVVPAEYITVWIALDETTASGGTIEYAKGSHRWARFPPMGKFHAPEDYREALRVAADKAGQKLEIVQVEVPAGGCAIHHGGTWHGSGPNRGEAPRRAAVSHCISSAATFHPTEVSYIYNRYKRVGDTAMDESFFPIMWTKDGYRTPFLDAYCKSSSA